MADRSQWEQERREADEWLAREAESPFYTTLEVGLGRALRAARAREAEVEAEVLYWRQAWAQAQAACDVGTPSMATLAHVETERDEARAQLAAIGWLRCLEAACCDGVCADLASCPGSEECDVRPFRRAMEEVPDE